MAWDANLTEHGAPSTDCSIVSLASNAEEDTLFVGLDTGALFCIGTTADVCSSVEEVHIWIPVLKQCAFDASIQVLTLVCSVLFLCSIEVFTRVAFLSLVCPVLTGAVGFCKP